jgi:hypothetical protein
MTPRQGRNEAIELIRAQNRRLTKAIRFHWIGFGWS